MQVRLHRLSSFANPFCEQPPQSRRWWTVVQKTASRREARMKRRKLFSAERSGLSKYATYRRRGAPLPGTCTHGGRCSGSCLSYSRTPGCIGTDASRLCTRRCLQEATKDVMQTTKTPRVCVCVCSPTQVALAALVRPLGHRSMQL